jgi:hypothetical protein
MSLLQQTNDLLQSARAKDLSLRSIANNSNGQVEYDWLKRFASGDISDPSVNRIQVLHDHLRSLLNKRRARN